jgi:hypothetical protein
MGDNRMDAADQHRHGTTDGGDVVASHNQLCLL